MIGVGMAALPGALCFQLTQPFLHCGEKAKHFYLKAPMAVINVITIWIFNLLRSVRKSFFWFFIFFVNILQEPHQVTLCLCPLCSGSFLASCPGGWVVGMTLLLSTAIQGLAPDPSAHNYLTPQFDKAEKRLTPRKHPKCIFASMNPKEVMNVLSNQVNVFINIKWFIQKENCIQISTL